VLLLLQLHLLLCLVHQLLLLLLPLPRCLVFPAAAAAPLAGST
jgi:hypothetical protein